jgi:hypothetical protein
MGEVTGTVFVGVQLASAVFTIEILVLVLQYTDEHLPACLLELSSQSTTPLGLMQYPRELKPGSGTYDWAVWVLLNTANMGVPIHKETREPAADVAKLNYAFMYSSFKGAMPSSALHAAGGCCLWMLLIEPLLRGAMEGPASTNEFRKSFLPFLGFMASYMTFFCGAALRFTSQLKFLTTFTEVSLFDRSSHMMKAIKFYAFAISTSVAIVWTLEVISLEFGGVWEVNDAVGRAVTYATIAINVCLSSHVLYSLTASPWRKLRALQDTQDAHWSQQIEAQYSKISSGSSTSDDPHEQVELFNDAQAMKGHVESVWSFPLGSAAIKPLAFSAAASLVPFVISLIQASFS